MKNVIVSENLKKLLSDVGINKLLTQEMDYIDILDEDYISFLPLDKVDYVLSNNLNPWVDNRNKIKIGRFFNKFFIFKDEVIEKFVNTYKTNYKLSIGDFSNIFKIVEGEDIKFWYNQNNYVIGGGSLNSSCMRGVSPDRFNLYSLNPVVCKLLIMVSKNNKLLSRALLWQTNNGIYIDRVYCRYDKDANMYDKYIQFHNYMSYNNRYSYRNIKVNIKRKNYGQLPYLDSFKYERGSLVLKV